MSAPTIDPESGALYYPQWQSWEHQFSATNNPYDWSIASGAFPTGMTFQPSYAGTASNSGDTINLTAHGLANGTCIVFRTLTGGTGLTATTVRYFVVNAAADTFQVSLTPGGAVVPVTGDYSAVLFYRPGFLTGAASVPGVSTVRLIATNGTGDSAEVLFTIGISPSAAVLDGNGDIVWDFATNNVIMQTTSALSLTPADRDTPILFVKEQDDLILRLRTTKGASVIDLGPITDGDCKLVIKELEPDARVLVSDNSVQSGTGTANSILIHAKFDGDTLAASLTNYEADAGTFYDALAELELTYPNPGYFGGTPATLVKTSKTFRIRIERDLGES